MELGWFCYSNKYLLLGTRPKKERSRSRERDRDHDENGSGPGGSWSSSQSADSGPQDRNKGKSRCPVQGRSQVPQRSEDRDKYGGGIWTDGGINTWTAPPPEETTPLGTFTTARWPASCSLDVSCSWRDWGNDTSKGQGISFIIGISYFKKVDCVRLLEVDLYLKCHRADYSYFLWLGDPLFASWHRRICCPHLHPNPQLFLWEGGNSSLLFAQFLGTLLLSLIPLAISFISNKGGEWLGERYFKHVPDVSDFLQAVEGLVHISELRREGRVANVADVVSKGQRVKVKVLSFHWDQNQLEHEGGVRYAADFHIWWSRRQKKTASKCFPWFCVLGCGSRDWKI